MTWSFSDIEWASAKDSWDDHPNRCPRCGHLSLTDGPGGGVVCSQSDCPYWFCY